MAFSLAVHLLDESADSSFDKVRRGLPVIVESGFLRALVVGSVEDAADDREGNLRWMFTAKVRMSPKRFQIARPTARWTGLISTASLTPSSSATSERSALTVRSPLLSYVALTSYGSAQSKALRPQVFQRHPSEAVRQPDLDRLASAAANLVASRMYSADAWQ